MTDISRAQAKVFECPDCKDSIFEPIAAVRLVFDRLDPDVKLKPVPAPLMRCLGCGGFLVRGEKPDEGVWRIVHPNRNELHGE